jgi:peptide/nickel transport system permease protein
MTVSEQQSVVLPAAPDLVVPGISKWKKLRRLAVKQPLGVAGLAVIVVLVVMATFARFIAPYDPTSIEFRSFQSPSTTHFFGTDNLGRDVFSRVVYGGQTSLKVGIIATFVGTFGGAIVGLTSGYFGGMVDSILQRFMDAMLAFPLLIFVLIMVAAFGNSIEKLMLLVGIGIIPGVGRVMRGVVLAEKQSLYVEAARSCGASAQRIMFRHILPNVLAPIIIIATSLLGAAILIEAGLSFLGLGTPPPTPSWGADLSGNARNFFKHAPWMAIFPGLALSLVVLGFNLLGDALRDILDPRLRNR